MPLAPRAKARPRQRTSIGNQLDEWRKIILNATFFAIFGILIFTAAKVLRSNDMVIEAIGLPKNIKDLGYTEDGAALLLSENIRRIAAKANSNEALLAIKAKFEDRDITVPVEGLSFDSIIRLLRQTFGLPQNRLIGDFVCVSDPCLSTNLELRLRLLQGTAPPKALAAVKGASHDAILQAAAERFMETTSPISLALYLYSDEAGPGRRADAIALAQRITTSDTVDRLAALNLIGAELLERPEKRPEDLNAAIVYFRQMIESDPSVAMAYTNWGAALSALGDKAGAIEKYKQAIALDPGEAMQQHNLGVVFASQGQNADAAAAFEKAIALDPNYADSYLGLGSAQMSGGNAAAALAAFAKAGTIAPDNADIQYNIGIAARGDGKPLMARQAFESYLRLKPDAADAVAVQGFITELSKE